MPAREVAVLIEDLRSQFRIFGEKLEALEDKFNGRLDNVDGKLENLETKVDGIATNQARTLERVTSLEITVRNIQTDIAEIKENLKDHSKRLTHMETVK